MTHFDRTKPGGFNDLDVPDGADWSDLDSKTERAINGDEGGTWAPSSTIYIGGEGMEGRLRPSAVAGLDASHTYYATGANQSIRVTSTVTGNRTYTLGSTGAVAGDRIRIFCDTTFTHKVFIHNAAGSTIYTLAVSDVSADGIWCECEFDGSDWIVSASAPSTKIQKRQFTWFSGGTIVFAEGTTQVEVEGIGGGGGGGGGTHPTIANTHVSAGGGAGGGGAIAGRKSVTINPGDTCTVTIGAGGAGGIAGADGGDGGDTSFVAGIILAARFRGAGGGAAGQVSNDTTPSFRTAIGGFSARQTLPGNQRFHVATSADNAYRLVFPHHGGNSAALGVSGQDGGAPWWGNSTPGAGGSPGSDALGYYGGAGGGGGGASGNLYDGWAAGAGGAGGAALVTNGAPGANGANALAGSGCGGGGGGGSGNANAGVFQAGGTGGNGGSGQLTVYYVGPEATITGA